MPSALDYLQEVNGKYNLDYKDKMYYIDHDRKEKYDSIHYRLQENIIRQQDCQQSNKYNVI